MEGSIVRTVLFNFLLQLSVLLAISITGNVEISSIFFYTSCLFVLHLLLALFLYINRKDFFNLSTNLPLIRINPANRITLLRISSLPTIAFLLRHRDIEEIRIILPILLAMVFLTDAFDGQVARRKKQITHMGQMLDSISDYSLLGVISIVYFRHNLLPVWFFVLVIFRLLMQALGMFIFILLKKPLATKSTWGGKITIATIMTLYLLELLKLYIPPAYEYLFTIPEYISAVIIFIFSFEKGRLFFRHAKKSIPTDTTCSPGQC